MNVGGIAKRLIDCANALVGHIRGGLALVNIVASMFFGGISGSAVADTSALGSVLIPGMVNRGYRPDFSAAVTSASASIGIIIPPSIPMILYAIVSEVSVGELFLAGVLPGILVGFGQMALAYGISVKKNYPVERRFNVRQAGKTIRDAFWALIMPIVILGSIISGICTPTESAGIAVAYGFIVSVFIYRAMRWKELWEATYRTVVTTSTIMIIIGFGAVVGWILSYMKIPMTLAELILSISNTKWVILLMINIFLILLGTFMHGTPIILVVVPILLPIVQSLGINLVHFGMIVIFNVGIGQQTPPLGTCLFITSALAKLDIIDVARANIPFIIQLIALLFLITYVPAISLFLPSFF